MQHYKKTIFSSSMLLFVLLLFPFIPKAQTPLAEVMAVGDSVCISGQVYSLYGNHKEVLPLARVYLLGTAIKTMSDAEGRFKLMLPQSGKSYTIRVYHINFGEKRQRFFTNQDQVLSPFVIEKPLPWRPCGDRLRRE